MTEMTQPRETFDLGRTTVGDAMTPRVIRCDSEAPLREIAWTMAHERVHCVVIADSEEAAGWHVLSDLDLVTGLAHDPDMLAAGAVAASETPVVGPDDSLLDAAQLMTARQAAHVLVVDDGAPVGVLSTLDIAVSAGSEA